MELAKIKFLISKKNPTLSEGCLEFRLSTCPNQGMRVPRPVSEVEDKGRLRNA